MLGSRMDEQIAQAVKRYEEWPQSVKEAIVMISSSNYFEESSVEVVAIEDTQLSPLP